MELNKYKSAFKVTSAEKVGQRHVFFFVCRLVVSVLVVSEGTAQTLPVGFPVIEEATRRNQLLGSFDSTFSFMLRPIYSEVYADSTATFQADTTSSVQLWQELMTFSKGKGSISLLPAQFRLQYNSTRPYGINNGAMIPAAGLQTLVSAGFFAKWGPLQVQLRPEMVYAGNKEFDTFEQVHDGVVRFRRYTRWNRIDRPERFGEDVYKKVLPGQSSVRINAKGLSAGFSTENIWWGPGKYNSLGMTSNAPGFQHFTVNTAKPLKTPVGHIEFQLISGKLDPSGFLPPDTAFVFNNRKAYQPKQEDWRYLNGLMASWRPKWINGFSIGGTRIVQQYSQTARTNKDYLPILTHLFRGSKPGLDDSLGRDQMLSVFARWVMENAKAEIYAEYGRTDASWNLRDFLMSPQHSRAFVIGFTKLLPLEGASSFLELNLEFARFERSGTQLLRADPIWYTNYQIRHGYTHAGEVVGAGIGPGSNMQNMGVAWVKGLNRVGIFYERVMNDNDFVHEAFSGTSHAKHYWADVGCGLLSDYHIGSFLLSGRAQVVRALNYQWEVVPIPGEPTIYRGTDLTNLFFSVNVAHLF